MLLEVEEHVEVCGQKGILNDLIDRIVSVCYANGTENMGRLKTDKYLDTWITPALIPELEP